MKEYVETGEVLSRVDMQGVIDLPEQYYVGTQRHGTIKESDKSMKEAFPTLMQYVSDKQIQTVGVPGSIYHVFDFKTGKMHYTAMAPVSKETYEGLEVEDGMLKGMVPATKAVKVAHTGSYKNLDNPWMAGFSYIRGKKLKQNKAIVPMDIYIDDPRKVEDKNLRTEIYIPVK